VTSDTLELILDAKLNTLKFMSDKKQSGDFHRKPILESNAVGDVDRLTDAKSYRPFNRKLKNAMEQTRPYARKAMEMLETITEQEITDSSLRDPKLTIKDTIIDVYLAKHITKYPDLEESLEEFNRDIWSVLDAKSEGEALGKLKSVQQGEGLMAFVRFHQGWNQRRSAIMHPGQCKHEHEIASAIEEWEEKYRILISEDKESELPASWRIVSMKEILCGDIKKHVDMQCQDVKSYDDLRATIMKWAVAKRIEKDRRHEMDVGSVEVEALNRDEQNPGDWTWVNAIDWNQSMGEVDYAAKGGGKGFNPGPGKGYMNPGAGKGQPWQQEKGGKGGGKSSNPMMQMAMAMMAKAMGKGKSQPWSPPGGKGGPKGDQSGCFNCGGKDHIARYCPKPIKETRTCNRCGTAGHLAINCRKSMPGGVNQVEGGEPESESMGGAGIIEWGDANLVELSEEPESKEFGDLPDIAYPKKKSGIGSICADNYNPEQAMKSCACEECEDDEANPANPEQTTAEQEMAKSKRPSAKQARKKKSKANRSAFEAESKSLTAALEASCTKIEFGFNSIEETSEVIGDVFPVEANEVNQGLEPSWRKKINGGYRLSLVMDSGAVKTIVPPGAIPGMVVKATRNTGKTFRVANGQEIPNQGETKIEGQSIEAQAMRITAQVAAITKPLAAANEMVDADNLIILHKEGGMVKKLTEAEKKAVMKILSESKGPSIPIKRKTGAFLIEIDVKESTNGFTEPKRPVKARANQSDDMDVDAITKGAWEAFWECREEEESGFPGQM